MKRQRPDDMGAVQQPVQKRTTYRAVPVNEQAPYRQLKVEDALAYLDKVKRQFGEQPYIYNQFLEIMKNFKAQTIDTPGVIARVSELFKGHNSLILGFNTFLPPDYKIEVVTEPVPRPQPRPAPVVPPAAPVMRQTRAAPPARREHGQPLEFDHAISYVTKIKRRFVNDPNTYKAFLDILHTYQKQQRSIKDVLEKVSHLFRDHPDLLQDFTYFLPDAVQPQVEQILRQNKVKGITPRSRRGARRAKMEHIDRSDHAAARAEREKARRRARRERARRADEPLQVSLPPSEKSFFQKIKSALGSRERWQEFLKCLDLYAREVITKAELITLVTDVFGSKHAPLAEDFKIMLNTRGMLEAQPEDVWHSLPVSEIDFSKCRQCTPSYRALPDSYPQFSTSERTAADASVLNDTWVSVPTGSEDFSFKSMRKNQYEEALFKCEDERYEVDMVLENNAAAIRVLEPLAEEIAALKAAEPTVWQFRLDSRSLGVLHLKAIARIYGDHGAEMLELLRKNPGGAIPVILKRLKEKDVEWKKVRQELNKVWKDVLEKNYHKSLDHRSFYFRQADKKAVGAKSMLNDLRSKAETQRDAGQGLPHVVMTHPDTSVHEDVANVLAYSINRSSNIDKERIAGLWASFIETMFRFPPQWSFGEQGGSDALLIGSKVSTPYGVGKIQHIRRSGSAVTFYVVKLPWASAVLAPAAVKRAARPEAAGASSSACRPGTSLYVGGNHSYYFFRLHALIMQRLAKAKELCCSAHVRRVVHPADRVAAEQQRNDAAAAGLGSGDEAMDAANSGPSADASGEDLYKYYLTALYHHIDGTLDTSKYEDECRTLMGTGSYLLFTLEKVIKAAVKQLVDMANDAADTAMRAEFSRQELVERSRTSPSEEERHALAVNYRGRAAAAFAQRGDDAFLVRYLVTSKEGDAKQSARLELSYLGHAVVSNNGAVFTNTVKLPANKAQEDTLTTLLAQRKTASTVEDITAAATAAASKGGTSSAAIADQAAAEARKALDAPARPLVPNLAALRIGAGSGAGAGAGAGAGSGASNGAAASNQDEDGDVAMGRAPSA